MNKGKYISWGDMSEEEKAEFFKSYPFKIKNYEQGRRKSDGETPSYGR
jgi:hypothetical protein